jgi:hydroxymethylpyrimidine/phosphomethylpyrimidine kinase
VLLDDEARAALIKLLLPRATVITPNVPEARVLAGMPDAAPERLIRALHCLGPAHVVITGGHRDEATDLFYDGGTLTEIPGDRFADGAAHGSGCTHSSVLAAHLALGLTPLQAARMARALAGRAVRDGLRGIGHGPGPVDVLGLAAETGRSARQNAGQAAIPLS